MHVCHTNDEDSTELPKQLVQQFYWLVNCTHYPINRFCTIRTYILVCMWYMFVPEFYCNITLVCLTSVYTTFLQGSPSVTFCPTTLFQVLQFLLCMPRMMMLLIASLTALCPLSQNLTHSKYSGMGPSSPQAKWTENSMTNTCCRSEQLTQRHRLMTPLSPSLSQ